ncbi:TadE/TadG family type IV pilus assembly protein [Sinorhizobium sp. BG8]|uniref:TadE/TadG family type IV pilus assembly protein n=1 Tax=Sinorhizobium sp. BG8 TaxID=2613773 RepID=UPI00193D6D33|nr:TadE/TadG family type IV pilus assembly protein [Sinorhizobium sp. BG8]QRM56783.1 pilus assembly protein [Sinorhizobium sp. BG8]
MRMRALVADRRGVGAVEFAIVAPLFIMLYVGAFEISVAMTVYRKVSRASSTISDLITQQQSVTTTTLDTMPTLAESVVAPFSAGLYTLKITGIAVSSTGVATVSWSRGWTVTTVGTTPTGTVPYTKNSSVTLPSDLEAKDTFLVRTEFSVPHEVLLMMPGLKGSTLTEIPLSKTSYFHQRVGTAVTCDCS